MMRVRKEDVFKDLPPINWDSVPVPLDTSMMSEADLAQMEDSVTHIISREGAHRPASTS